MIKPFINFTYTPVIGPLDYINITLDTLEYVRKRFNDPNHNIIWEISNMSFNGV
jgi:hypothetical protein